MSDDQENKSEGKRRKRNRRDESQAVPPPAFLNSSGEPDPSTDEAAETVEEVAGEPQGNQEPIGTETETPTETAATEEAQGSQETVQEPAQESADETALDAKISDNSEESTLPPTGAVDNDIDTSSDELVNLAVKNTGPLVQRWDEFLSAMSKPTMNSIYEQGVSSFTELLQLTATDLLLPRGRFTQASLDEMSAWLQQCGESLKPAAKRVRRPTTTVTSTVKGTRHFTQAEMQDRANKRASRLKR